jgi:8-oxo-dGTP pyrophosphatase MutT (NUDIX family)
MSTDSGAILKALHTVLSSTSKSPYPHVPTPHGCKKRASVAVIIRVRPPYKPVPAASQSTVNVDAGESPATSINHFFSKQWVQEGDPEILFIKRAGRAGDRWSGHTALPGGKRDPEDVDDCAAAIRETREEIGLDLDTVDCIQAGNLPERIVAATWGKEALMVLCPYLFLITSRSVPTLQPQPTEVASTHWVPLRALLSPSTRTLEYVDISSRMAKQAGPVAGLLLRLMMGKMEFSAINLVPTESVYASSVAGFIPGGIGKAEKVSGWAQQPYGTPQSSKSLAHQQPILLWGLTLGVLADFLDLLPPYNAVKLWRYPTFTTPDLRFLVWLFTFRLRRSNAGDLSSGTWPKGTPWPSDTASDATTQAVAVNEEPTQMAESTVGISGLGVGQPGHAVARLLSGYYDRVNVAIGVFILYRTVAGAALAYSLVKAWRRRRTSRL